MEDHLRDATKKMDFVSRETAAEQLRNYKIERDLMVSHNDTIDFAISVISAEVTPADVAEVVRCKNCKHRPVVVNPSRPYGFGLAGPGSDAFDRDETCPYLCDDGYYNRMPDDDGFCNLGEAKDG